MSIRCLIFKVLSALRVSVRAFLLYHARFALSSTFSDFFKIFFWFLTAPRLRQLYYCITSSSLCQELFSSFFKIFSFPLRSDRLPAPALFPLSGGFLRFSDAVSLRQLHYITTSFPECQALFSSFFMFVECALFSPVVIDIRH